MYVGFMDLEKAYDRVNSEALWHLLRMYDVCGKLLNGIKNMYVNSLVCVRVKWGESKGFRIGSGVRQRCIMAIQCVYECSDERLKMGWGLVRDIGRRRESGYYLAS